MDFGKRAGVTSNQIEDMQEHVNAIKNGQIKNFIFLALTEDGNEIIHVHCHSTITSGLLKHAEIKDTEDIKETLHAKDMHKFMSSLFNSDDD